MKMVNQELYEKCLEIRLKTISMPYCFFPDRCQLDCIDCEYKYFD
jgi:hypothetical protein